jgi:glycerol-3-phosphate dehydrogenase subunit B
LKRHSRRIETELAVIGTGIAGCAASIFARQRGIEVAQFGHSGAIAYTTGYFDLLGLQDGRVLDDPWAGLAALRRSEPRHPLSRLSDDDIREALARFTETVTNMGIAYSAPGARNLSALLPYGAAKPTLSVPATMRPGIEAMQQGAPTLLVDFEGLQGFSAREFQVNAGPAWPDLRMVRFGFPDLEGGQVFPEVMARMLETRATREALAALIRPHLAESRYLGLPAILGIHAPDAVRAAMEALLGLSVFEIPTIPPAVAGIRLRELFERELPALGVRLEPQNKVSEVAFDATGATLGVHTPMEDLEVRAGAVILATGRFLSGGLRSDRDGVSETLVGLPIAQPDTRDAWFRHDWLDPEGHPVNRLGVAVDAAFRPLGAGGRPFSGRLFAAGALLAHQDWVRQRCGAGLAIATAYGAVRAAGDLV